MFLSHLDVPSRIRSKEMEEEFPEVGEYTVCRQFSLEQAEVLDYLVSELEQEQAQVPG